MRRLRAAIGVNELMAVLGLGLLTAGIALMSIPAALIVLGSILFGLAVWPLLCTSREK